MKKILMSLMAVCMMAVAFGLTSCDPNKAQCWKITLTSRESGAPTLEYYFYGTGVESDAQLEMLASSNPGYSATKVQTFLSKDNCHK